MFPTQFGNYELEFHISNQHMSESNVTITDLLTKQILYIRPIEVWSPEKKADYFFRETVIDQNNQIWKTPYGRHNSEIKYIIFTSYNGLEIWDNTLTRIFFLEISDKKKYKDVYSFDIIDNYLYTWSANKATSLVKHNFKNLYGKRYNYLLQQYHQMVNNKNNIELPTIINELQQLNKLKNVSYNDIYNVSESIITKHIKLI